MFGLLPLEAGEIRWNGETVHDPAVFQRPRAAGSPQSPPVL
jgi:hypothetical protein